MRYLLILSVAVCLSFMLLPACAPQPQQQAEPVTEEAPGTEADVDAVNKVAEDFVAALNACDVEAMIALCADDEVVMPPNEPLVVGRKAIESWLNNWCDTFIVKSLTSIGETETMGDWAFIHWTSTFSLTPKAEAEPVQDDLKGLWIFKRQPDGAWKFTHAIWNSDNPLPGQPTT